MRLPILIRTYTYTELYLNTLESSGYNTNKANTRKITWFSWASAVVYTIKNIKLSKKVAALRLKLA